MTCIFGVIIMIKIPTAGYVALKGEELNDSLEVIKEDVKSRREKSLKQIQEETVKKQSIVKPVIVPKIKKEKIIETAIIQELKVPDDDSIPPLYATDPNDPKNDAFFTELKNLKRTNPQLYKKIISMN